jgi:hypothetical protein
MPVLHTLQVVIPISNTRNQVSVFCHRLLEPIQWDECSLTSPGFFDKCPLKPLIAKIRVFRHDDLK